MNRPVWAPDLFGSIAFLIASHVAWLTVRGRSWRVRSNDPDGWAAILNYLGSIFFMLSAIASVTLPTTGEVLTLIVVNSGTFLGAVCFFRGVFLLFPPGSCASETNRGAEPAPTIRRMTSL